MVMTRVRVVSDSHLSSRTAEATANWSVVVDDVAADPPDLVVHTGDITLDGAGDPADLEVARDLLGRLDCRTACIPGNHDLGDNPRPRPGGWRGRQAQQVSLERLAAYRDRLGPDRWVVDVPGWRLVGLNTLLFGSGLAEEDEQWAWLSTATAAPSGAPAPPRLVLFVHKPLLPPPDRTDEAPARYAPSPGRDRLLDLVARAPAAVVVSGHVHQFRQHLHPGPEADALHVWVPSTWAVIPDRFQTRLGDKVCGVVDLELPAGGPGRARAELRRPSGLAHNVLVDGIPDPYTTAR